MVTYPESEYAELMDTNEVEIDKKIMQLAHDVSGSPYISKTSDRGLIAIDADMITKNGQR